MVRIPAAAAGPCHVDKLHHRSPGKDAGHLQEEEGAVGRMGVTVYTHFLSNMQNGQSEALHSSGNQNNPLVNNDGISYMQHCV